MKKTALIMLTVAFVAMVGLTTGCDNRSQMEKDADKAMSKMEGALK